MLAVDLDRLLPKVTRPARYTDGEWNAVPKDWETTPVRIALVYPDIYEVGMSNAGLAIIYDCLNQQPGVLAERAFAPWPDMEAELRRSGTPLPSLESRRPLRDFDAIGFSLGYELTYTNVLNVLDLAGVPLLADDRSGTDPIVIAGGSCVLNPEPLAPFVDLFVIGEGEAVVGELATLLRGWKDSHGRRDELLRAAACLDGVYVPSLYEAGFDAAGFPLPLEPRVPEARAKVRRLIVEPLPAPLTRQIVPYIETVHDRAWVEVQRGCTRGCRFCQAGVIYRPLRNRPKGEVVAAAAQILANTGHNELSLLALSPTDYPGIEELVSDLARCQGDAPFTISLPSLRMDSFSVGLADALPGRHRGGFTFAPEAGSERLRSAINKPITDDKILSTAELVFRKGWTNLKLYFMVGLPTETDADVRGIVELVRRLRDLGRSLVGGRFRLRVSATAFIPKAHTPFQWAPQATIPEIEAKNRLLSQSLRGGGVSFSWEDPRVALLEAVFSRGDRRLGRVVLAAWQRGCRLDAWSEHFNFERWLAAFDEAGLDPAFYAYRERSLTEPLPWQHIDSGVSQGFLRREYDRTFHGRLTPDCQSGPCAACGLEAWSRGCGQKFTALKPNGVASGESD